MIKNLKHRLVHRPFRFIETLLSVKYEVIKNTPFCLPFGKAAVRLKKTFSRTAGYPISGACEQAHAKARSRWLLRGSSIRHSPLDALDLGHPRLSLN